MGKAERERERERERREYSGHTEFLQKMTMQRCGLGLDG